MRKLILFFALLFVINGYSQKTSKPNLHKAKDTVGKKITDTSSNKIAIPPSVIDTTVVLADSIEYFSNRDVMMMDKVIRYVFSSPEFIQADAVTRYEIMTYNLNKVVLLPARQRWEAKNKRVKPK